MGLSILITIFLASALLKTALGLAVVLVVSAPAITGMTVISAALCAGSFMGLLLLPALASTWMFLRHIFQFWAAELQAALACTVSSAMFITQLFLPIIVSMWTMADIIITHNFSVWATELQEASSWIVPAVQNCRAMATVLQACVKATLNLLSVNRQSTLIPGHWKLCTIWLNIASHCMRIHVVPVTKTGPTLDKPLLWIVLATLAGHPTTSPHALASSLGLSSELRADEMTKLQFITVILMRDQHFSFDMETVCSLMQSMQLPTTGQESLAVINSLLPAYVRVATHSVSIVDVVHSLLTLKMHGYKNYMVHAASLPSHRNRKGHDSTLDSSASSDDSSRRRIAKKPAT